MNDISIFDSAVVLRNFLDGINVAGGNTEIIKVYLINIKHVKRRNEKEEFIFLKDIKSDKDIYGYPMLDETLRTDIFKFFNINMTNYVNRKLKSVYANIKLVNSKPAEAVVTIENYAEDMPELIKMANSNAALEKALRKIEFVESIELTDDVIEDLKSMCYISENVIPLIFVNTMYAVKVEKTTIPHNTTYEKGLPVLIKDPSKIFPQSGISPATIDDETLVFTDKGMNIINRNFNENLSLRKFNPDEIFAYKVYDS